MLDKKYLDLIKSLEIHGIEPVLYGSVAVSLYLGRYKATFDDLDLLVPDKWLEDKWPHLQEIMHDNHLDLKDKAEHEFESSSGMKVAFAKLSVLEQDGICQVTDTVTMVIPDAKIKTLSANHLLKAYEFSAKDGYRLDMRHKNDEEVIRLLQAYIAKGNLKNKSKIK